MPRLRQKLWSLRSTLKQRTRALGFQKKALEEKAFTFEGLVNRPALNASALLDAHEYASLAEFEISDARSGVSRIWHKSLPIDFALRTSPGAPLVVVYHGAAPEDVRLPFFSGLGITKELNANVLMFSDPSLFLEKDLYLSWFAGNLAQKDLSSALAKITAKIKSEFNAPRVIFFGGSGGGFAAMRSLEFFPSETAVAMNPQTDIERYHPGITQNYIDSAWECDRLKLKVESGTTVFPAVDSAVDNGGQVLYMQNANDDFHIKQHLEPFAERYTDTPGFWLLQEAWRKGHTPPPKELIEPILASLIGKGTSEIEAFGFRPL